MFMDAGNRIAASILRAVDLSLVLCSNRCWGGNVKVEQIEEDTWRITLNWKLRTGGSLRILSLLLASYESSISSRRVKMITVGDLSTYMSGFTFAATVLLRVQLLWLGKPIFATVNNAAAVEKVDGNAGGKTLTSVNKLQGYFRQRRPRHPFLWAQDWHQASGRRCCWHFHIVHIWRRSAIAHQTSNEWCNCKRCS